MRIDPVLRLALSIYENKGAYGLLLGSGVSRAAGVPTGWEIVVDLSQRLATLQGATTSDPVEWYRNEFGAEPEYTSLLQQIAGTPTERRALLRRYFEPTDEEREQGLKTPTQAHHAIAQLVKSGYFRLIITTNFDRLIETALEEAGVTPAVISSDDQLRGASPYVHEQAMVIKLHGDYRDARIKNTADELSKYSPQTKRFLDRAFDEFGWIVCGWSGSYDQALKSAILKSSTRRYSWFWLAHGSASEESLDVIRTRRADVVAIESADAAFERIHSLVQSLEDENQPHPISTPLAVATAKRYMSDPRFRIMLEDLVNEETRLLLQELASERISGPLGRNTYDDLQALARSYEAVTERLSAVLAAIAYYDRGDNSQLISSTITRVATTRETNGLVALLNLRDYPALLLVYTAGIAALASRNFKNLSTILLKPRATTHRRTEIQPITYVTNTWTVMNREMQKTLPRENATREHTPLSNFLQDLLRPLLSAYILSDHEFEDLFDIFEYFLSLVYADQVEPNWQPFGAYSWRWRDHDDTPMKQFFEDNLSNILAAGFFKGSPERFQEVLESHQTWLRESVRQW